MVMEGAQLGAAFMVGVLGGVHCLGMCGGVTGALVFGLPVSVQRARVRLMLYQLAYNLGRIFSYAVAGAAMGGLGAATLSLADLLPVQRTLQTVAGLFMIALSLYLAGIWQGLVKVERLGGRLWRRLQPLAQSLTPVKSWPQAWLYGMVWGWLPCGLVYSMLIWALAAGGMLQGAAIMAAFGLGTLPNLLLMGFFAFYFTRLARQPWVRRIAGLMVAALGVRMLYLAWTISA